MKAVRGAIIILAGTVLLGASILTDTIMIAANQIGHTPYSSIALLVGTALVVIGFIVTVARSSTR